MQNANSSKGGEGGNIYQREDATLVCWNLLIDSFNFDVHLARQDNCFISATSAVIAVALVLSLSLSLSLSLLFSCLRCQRKYIADSLFC